METSSTWSDTSFRAIKDSTPDKARKYIVADIVSSIEHIEQVTEDKDRN